MVYGSIQIAKKTFITLLYVTLTTLFRHAKTFVDGEYVHNRNAPSVSALNLYYTWLLDVSPTSIVLRGGTILF